MTDWRTLPAGVELDRLVADRVMGWASYSYGDMPERSADGAIFDGEPLHGSGLVPFQPSTDIADAWRVVEAMRGLGFAVDICDVAISSTVPLWAVSFFPAGPDTEPPNEHSAPLAICRAALAALEDMGDE